MWVNPPVPTQLHAVTSPVNRRSPSRVTENAGYGHAQDDDMVMALPPEMIDQALKGMETLYRRGIRYPISFAGAERDLTTSFPMAYGGISQLEAIRGIDNRLLLGVTGGIASGKTTVADMLREKGAAIIDFDVLARLVVEPDKPAWNKIVNFFGEQVLSEDRTLDRKALSQIVFNDMEKRKKLESFTHPEINNEFIKQLNEIVAADPNAIIQVVIPLLLELNLQYLFHKTLVVYVPQEEMVPRLAQRDNISEEEARKHASLAAPHGRETWARGLGAGQLGLSRRNPNQGG